MDKLPRSLVNRISFSWSQAHNVGDIDNAVKVGSAALGGSGYY